MRPILFYQEFDRLSNPTWGLMGNSEVTRLFFNYGAVTGASPNGNPNRTADVYIDLAAAMSAVNRKQYHQVKRDGTPLCYAITVSALKCKSGMAIAIAANNWTIRNAVKKTAIGWKRQLKHGGVKVSDLPTYAKRFRCAFDQYAHKSTAGQQYLELHLQPICADQVSGVFTQYTDAMGDAANYENTNEIVMVPVETDPDVGTVVEYRMNLLGTSGSGEFGIVEEFLKSRRNIRDSSDPTLEFPDIDNLLDPLFATADELTDDIVEAAQDYNTARPYTEEDADRAMVGVLMSASTPGIIQTESCVVPLGLMKMQGLLVDPTTSEPTYAPNDVTDAFWIDVHAIYEM